MRFKKYGDNGFNAVFMSIIPRSFRQVGNRIRFRTPNRNLIFSRRCQARATDTKSRSTNICDPRHICPMLFRLTTVVCLCIICIFFHSLVSTLLPPFRKRDFLVILACPAKSRRDEKNKHSCRRHEKSPAIVAPEFLLLSPSQTYTDCFPQTVCIYRRKTITHPF